MAHVAAEASTVVSNPAASREETAALPAFPDKQKPDTWSRRETALLLIAVFTVGMCTILYELLIGSVSSYFLGDSVRQFSLTIGLTMSAMGVGTYISRFIRGRLAEWFLGVEILLGLVGGLCVPLLYGAFLVEDLYLPLMLGLIGVIGVLIGLEIPLLTRLMARHYALKENIANVFSLDYLGALVATLLFPFVLLPVAGIFKSSLISGLLNLAVAGLTYGWFRAGFSRRVKSAFITTMLLSGALLCLVLVAAEPLIHGWETNVYDDRVVLSRQTPYQKMVLTESKGDYRLYLDGNLQFSSVDEYRYHEPLVHIPMAVAPHHESVLVLGGGDGMAVRELLRYRDLKRITLVDLDPDLLRLFRNNPLLTRLNRDSLDDPRVKIHNEDAFRFLERTPERFDVVLVDLPDPNNVALARLYSREFYRLVRQHLSRGGVMVTQATSPYFASKAFWCIDATIGSAGFAFRQPYHAYVPSFGDWGYVMASDTRLPEPESIRLQLPMRFLDRETLRESFHLPSDVREVGIQPSGLDHPKILDYYLQGWQHWK